MADTSIKDTRSFMTVLTRRTHECFNGHTFSTVEIPTNYLWKKFLLEVEAKILARCAGAKKRADRQKFILANPDLTPTSLGVKFGVTDSLVRKIRKAAARELEHS